MTVTATAMAAAATLGAAPSSAAPQPRDFNAGPQSLSQRQAGDEGTPQRLADRAVGRQAYLVTLTAAGTSTAFKRAGGSGTAAKSAAREQLDTVEAAQRRVIGQLPSDADVLYRTHAALPAVGVLTSASLKALEALGGVAAVYPIAPKTRANSTAVQLQGAPAAWVAHGETGEGARIAIIDTGIDYTHSNFGGDGDVATYESESALADTPVDTSALFPTAKVVGGYDFAGDAYAAGEPGAAGIPKPDPNPLDCNGHGSHVAGSAAGFGENADGTTYTGAYNAGTPFSEMKIGPGMAPEAELIALKVFGCDGSTNVTAEAIDYAVDPNGDGDPSDHVDVANLSLGSEYGSPNDGDAVMADAASKAGVLMAISAGNSGDVQDVSGSPGSSVRAITVANTVDATSVIDGVTVTYDGLNPQKYGQSRAQAYTWTTKPDLTGQVVELPAPNDTACAPLTDAQKAVVTGKVAIVTWTAEALECGSVARGKNLRDAGATGFLFHNSNETPGGIFGDTVIPGVLVVESGGDAIRAAIQGGQTVNVTGTSYGDVTQNFPGDTDTVNSSTSRGGHAAGALKPDVSAVGTSVYSTAVGTGTRGDSFSGTSMAAPMVAGLAALVKEVNPTWTSEMVKADIMNTAGQDLFLGQNRTGATYAPNRVGAGRIKADVALDNKVLAYVGDGSGAVSVSFGAVEVTGPMSMTKTITVQNTGASPATYATSYAAATSVPGTSYSVTPASVTVPAGGTASVEVTFNVSGRGALTKTADPTTGRDAIAYNLPREVLSSASGRVVLTPQGEGIALRVPVYAAPRPASEMSQAAELTMPAGAVQTAQLTLAGADLTNGVLDGDPANDIFSLAAGFGLAAVDGTEPTCSATVTAGCITLPEERFADVANVGVTSDYPVQGSQAASQAYFAVNAHGAWSTPASKIEYDLYIDTNGDKNPELVAYNTRLTDEDVFVVNLVQLSTGKVIDTELLNNRFGDVDTAAFDSDTMIMPVWLEKLKAFGINPSNPRVNYGVISYSAYSADYVDAVGMDPVTGLVSLSADLFTPGISVTDANGQAPLVLDKDNSELTVTRNAASYAADGGKGLMMVHLHNKVGAKTQVVTLKDPVAPTTPPNPPVPPAPTPVPPAPVPPAPAPTKADTETVVKVKPKKPGFKQNFKVVAIVDSLGGTTPSGIVKFRLDGKKIGSATLDDGRVVLKIRKNIAVGMHHVVATYKGDATNWWSRDRLRFWVVR